MWYNRIQSQVARVRAELAYLPETREDRQTTN
jgi:hypothetical protein